MKLFSNENQNKILFVASEAAPFARAGGLGSVMYSLPRALNKIGYDCRVMIPRYLNIEDSEHIKMEFEGLMVPTGNKDDKEGEEYFICNVKKFDNESQGSKDKSVITYFLENMEYYEQRANIYGYADDPVRWALLCKGVLEFLKVSSWVPDIIVCADWQIGFLPNYLKTVYANDKKLAGITTLFSIHNLSFQGNFNHHFIQESEYDDGHSPIPGFNDPRLLKINGMRRGIMYADTINTVSPTYAKEIMTPAYGEGMDAILSERRSVVHGILNGIDYNAWDPEKDVSIEHQFSSKDLEARGLNKKVLQDRFGLEAKPDTLLLSIVSRLTEQKGLDLVMEVMPSLLSELNIQLVVLGEGEDKYMHFFQDLQKKFPTKVGIDLKFDQVLPHTVFAGADAALVPSHFEPSGLTQMEAMRYGAVPIVRKTGGLGDTVEDYSPTDTTSTGFVFEKYSSESFLIAVVRAYENFQNKRIWQGIQKRSMSNDFSWDSSAKKYKKIIDKTIAMKKKKGTEEAN